MRRGIYFIGTLLLIAAGGCDSGKSETGYQPRHLGMNGSELRSLYAPAFSPESKVNDADKHDALPTSHRPGT